MEIARTKSYLSAPCGYPVSHPKDFGEGRGDTYSYLSQAMDGQFRKLRKHDNNKIEWSSKMKMITYFLFYPWL